MSRDFLGAIDQGTTGTQFAIVDRDGSIVELAFAAHETIRPHSEQVEFDPRELWENTKRVIERALTNADIPGSQLASIGIANQRQTTVLWDAQTGIPLSNAIAWNDRRTGERMEAIRGTSLEAVIRERTGLIPDGYFAASKLEWLLDELDDERSSRDVRFGTIDSWLVYNLTGAHVTDVTNASQTMLYNIHDGQWDDRLLDEFDVPLDVLPEVRPSSDTASYGSTDVDGVLDTDVPVCAALGDQQAALIGQTCFAPGEAKTTYGTGSFFVRNTGTDPVPSEQLLTSIGYQFSGEPVQYVLEGPMFTAGNSLDWLKRVGILDEGIDLESTIHGFSSNGTFFVPAIDRFGSPHWMTSADGTLTGLTTETRREHIIRAVLESIAFHTSAIVALSNEDTGTALERMYIDSGLANIDAFCQLQAAALDMELLRPNMTMTTALGAAYAAGLAVDFWDSKEELREKREFDRTFSPDSPETSIGHTYRRWTEIVREHFELANSDSSCDNS